MSVSPFGRDAPVKRVTEDDMRKLICDHGPEPFSPVCGCSGTDPNRCPCRDTCESHHIP